MSEKSNSTLDSVLEDVNHARYAAAKSEAISRSLSWFSAAIGAAALVVTMTYFFSQERPVDRVDVTVHEVQAAVALIGHSVDKTRADIKAIQQQLEAITEVPDEVALNAELARTRGLAESLDERLMQLEAAILEDPQKAIALPLLRNDIERIRESYSTEIVNVRAEIDRVYDQNKWFVGLMFTMAVALIGLAVSNVVKPIVTKGD